MLEEVLGFSGWINPCPFVTALGCSLGAYHAANIVLRHPDRFGKLVALSGRYDLTRSIEHFGDLFDGYYDETIYFHTPCHFVPNLHDPWRLDAIRRLEIVLAIGDEDPFRETNHHLRRVALGKRGLEFPSFVAGTRRSRRRLATDGRPLCLTARSRFRVDRLDSSPC